MCRHCSFPTPAAQSPSLTQRLLKGTGCRAVPKCSHHGQCWGELVGIPRGQGVHTISLLHGKASQGYGGNNCMEQAWSRLKGAWKSTSFNSFYDLVSPSHTLPCVVLPQWPWFCHPNSPFLVFIGRFSRSSATAVS